MTIKGRLLSSSTTVKRFQAGEKMRFFKSTWVRESGSHVDDVGGVAAQVIGTACASQGWWLARGAHFSVREFSCVYPTLYYIRNSSNSTAHSSW